MSFTRLPMEEPTVIPTSSRRIPDLRNRSEDREAAQLAILEPLDQASERLLDAALASQGGVRLEMNAANETPAREGDTPTTAPTPSSIIVLGNRRPVLEASTAGFEISTAETAPNNPLSLKTDL
jgi:hypothetical protein